MASLASFPQELVDMIFSDLGPTHLGKVRLLSRFHNARFKNLFWYLVFQTLQIDLRPSCVERLILLGKGPEVASMIQNIIVRPQQGQDLKVSQITPLLTKAFAGLPDIKSIDIQVPRGTNGFDYWKPIMDAAIKSKRGTVESITGPKCGMQMSKLKFSTAQTIAYQNAFINLKNLDITVSVQYERPELAEKFWTWIERIGSQMERLTIKTTRTSHNMPSPNDHGGFLPRNFSLPKLKALKLIDAAVTPNDFKKFFGNVDMEVVDISQCRMKNPKVNWFKILKHLRNGNLNKIRELRFSISSRHGSGLYDLPNLLIDVNSDWTSEGNSCKVKLHSGLSGFYNTQKNLWDELGATDDQDDFWGSLTNSKWTLPRTTRWKRLQIATEEYRFAVSKLVSVFSSEHEPQEAFEVQQEYDTKVARLQEEEELDIGVGEDQ
ncbi:hypothetical protein TWF970_004623 [Orbilia oligospora]|uniref:F-box domain-containing protein n=1 Tax=Orbilia oligospora TaxID=2813651 RepID=A0A7C8VE04_ORBOL|nr:hypothetical protein TWF970_004623 [Orbilia oligospora]